MMIRSERPGDEEAISAITEAAFADHPHSDQTEHLIVERLRDADALTVSLVAEEDGRIVGHIAFSPVSLSGNEGGWYGLGPVSVAPDRQGQGIGGALIRAGLDRLRKLDAAGCVVAGDPALYCKFGFAHRAELQTQDIPPEYFMILPLHGAVPSGIVAYHPGFYGDAA